MFEACDDNPIKCRNCGESYATHLRDLIAAEKQGKEFNEEVVISSCVV